MFWQQAMGGAEAGDAAGANWEGPECYQKEFGFDSVTAFQADS